MNEYDLIQMKLKKKYYSFQTFYNQIQERIIENPMIFWNNNIDMAKYNNIYDYINDITISKKTLKEFYDNNYAQYL